MEKNAVIFLDFNETFDDIHDHKGKILFWALSRFINHFNGNVDIVVITSAPYGQQNFTIRPELRQTVSCFSRALQQHFKYLIEQSNLYLTEIDLNDDVINFGATKALCSYQGNKKDGIEAFLKNKDYHTCVFAGNNEQYDLIMMDSQAKIKEKYFLLANSRMLKTEKYPVYRLSMQKPNTLTYNYGKKILEEIKLQDQMIIKTGTKSYGLGRGFEALTSYLEEKDNYH